MKPHLRRVKIVERDLSHMTEVKGDGAKGYRGYTMKEGEVVIEKNLPTFDYLDTLIHELFHEMMPGWSESTVEDAATWLAIHLWKSSLRRRMLENPGHRGKE